MATGKPQPALKLPDAASLWSAAFTPDGKTLIVHSRDNLVLVWDPATGKEMGRWRVEDGESFTLTLAPDGKSLALACRDGTVRLWDAATGKEKSRLKASELIAVRAIWSPDGKRLVSYGYEGVLRFWDAATGKLLGKETASTQWGLMAFTPDGKDLVVSEG